MIRVVWGIVCVAGAAVIVAVSAGLAVVTWWLIQVFG